MERKKSDGCVSSKVARHVVEHMTGRMNALTFGFPYRSLGVVTFIVILWAEVMQSNRYRKVRYDFVWR